MLCCDLSDPSVSYDPSWWDPIGMRGTVSYLVEFDHTFISEENFLGRPGQYIDEGWQSCFTPHYASSFLGAAEAAYDYALESVQAQKRAADPFVQHRIAHMSNNVETSHLWLRNVARLWETGQCDAARLAGARARFLVEHLAEETVKHCINVCGARSLNRPSALERIYRDLSFYVRHDNADQVLATIGKSTLGQTHDVSFFKG